MSWSPRGGHLLQGALYPGPPGLPTSLRKSPHPAPWLLLSIGSHQSHTLFLETRLQVTVPFSLVATSCSLLLLSMLVRSTASRGCRGDLVPACAHRRGAQCKPSPYCWSARVWDLLPTPLQVDCEVMVRME